jgi:hypothetical protein
MTFRKKGLRKEPREERRKVWATRRKIGEAVEDLGENIASER